MAEKTRLKMRREDRAKQFAPFAALKGYEEALRARERVIVAEPKLSEDDRNELDRLINQVEFGNVVKVKYYINQEYLELSGIVSRIDIDARIIKIVNTKIDFKDIYYLELL